MAVKTVPDTLTKSTPYPCIRPLRCQPVRPARRFSGMSPGSGQSSGLRIIPSKGLDLPLFRSWVSQENCQKKGRIQAGIGAGVWISACADGRW